MKKCSRCEKIKELIDFPKASHRKDGLSSWCKQCHCESARQWRLDNLERAKEKDRRWRKEHPERVRERTRIWHQNNKEKVREGAHRYYIANKEKVFRDVKRWGSDNSEKKREYRRRWRVANPEKIAELDKNWSKKNPEKKRESARKYRETHLEKVLNRLREWQKNNPEKRRECERRWAKHNPEKIRRKNMLRHAKKKKAVGAYTLQEWIDKIKEYNGKCAYCGQEKPLTVDHIVPLSRGGTNYIENIKPACTSCNSSKGNKLLEEWLSIRKAKESTSSGRSPG